MGKGSLGNLGEAKVIIRADWGTFDKDLSKAKGKISKAFSASGKAMRNVGAAMTAGLTVPLTALIGFSTKAASRVNELASVNELLGKSAGYSGDYVRAQADSVQGMGIEAAASQEIIADFIKAELDLADASKVARVAQDAAVISGQNSTETTKTLTKAIITGRTELFKSAGMIIDLNQAYEDYAELTGRSAAALSEQEKVQARVNATMAYGERIAGAYAKAMEDPGKVLRSYPRYLNDVAVAFGQNFIPAFGDAIKAGKNFLEWLKEAVSEGGALSPVIQKWGERFGDAAEFIGKTVDKLDEMDPKMLQTIADIVAMGAAMGPVLMIGGQLTMWASAAINVYKSLSIAFGAIGDAMGVGVAAAVPYAAAIAAVIVGLIELKKYQDKRNIEMRDEISQTLTAASTYEEYSKKMREAAIARGLIVSESGNLISIHGGVIDSNYMLSESEYEAKQALQEHNDEVETGIFMGGQYGGVIEETYQGLDILKEQLAATAEAEAAFQEALSITSNFSSIISMAQSYDKALGEIDEKQARVQELLAIEGGGYLDGVWMSAKDVRDEIGLLEGDIADLQQSMTDMANQMVLDMFQATLAIGGFTDAEMQAYFDMAAEMGLISKEASDAAMENYFNAKEEIEGNAIVIQIEEEGLDAVLAGLNSIPHNIETIHTTIRAWVNAGGAKGGGSVGKGNISTDAAGGLLGAGDISVVGERGPELFIPKVAGSIIANSELMRSLRGSVAGSGRGSGTDAALMAALLRIPTAQDIARAVRDAVLVAVG